MYYHYDFFAAFLSGGFRASVISPALARVLPLFNGLPRKDFKRLSVSIDPVRQCLRFSLDSSLPQRPENYLRCCQYFSKLLAAQPSMAPYVAGGRLLEQC